MSPTQPPDSTPSRVGPKVESRGEHIDSTRHPVARRVADVLRPSKGTRRIFVVDDEQNIARAARSGVAIDSLYVAGGSQLSPDMLARADRDDLPVHVLSTRVARALFGTSKRARVFALARRDATPTLADLTGRPGDIVVLDGVRLAGNIGAITRSAAAFDAAGVVLIDSGLRSTVDRRLIRASRGLVFTIPVIMATRAELLDHLREQDLPLSTTTTDRGTDLRDVRDIHRRIAVVLGSETDGTSQPLTDQATHRLHIPIHTRVESLNVSAAAAILLYERRDRGR